MNLRVGIIGYKNHAARLIKLIRKNRYCDLSAVYHPDKKTNHTVGTNDLQDLYKCDAVIISSPSQTHYEYIINLLDNFDGYIFCEKPPVCCLSHIKILSGIKDPDKHRIYFNYNLRFGHLNNIINDSYYLEKLGDIQHINILKGHGLAFKNDYSNSWRADGRLNPHAITETLAIHYVDLLKFNYGEIIKYFYSPAIVANTGTSFDTVHISLEFTHLTASIFASYACPFVDGTTIIGTDGILKIAENNLHLYHPRDSFNSDGSFTEPPLIKREIINTQNEYLNSLSESFDFFIDHVNEGSSIDTKHFNTGLSSNRFLLEMQKAS